MFPNCKFALSTTKSPIETERNQGEAERRPNPRPESSAAHSWYN